jgi:hypothetical protein
MTVEQRSRLTPGEVASVMVATTAFMASVISSSPNTDLFLFLLGSTNVLLGTPEPPTVALASIVGKGGCA